MNDPIFVTFEPVEDGFRGSVPMEKLDALGNNPELELKEASRIYQNSVSRMQLLLAEMAGFKARRSPIPARKVWELGDAVMSLTCDLGIKSMELDDLYKHLVRDLGMNEKRLGTMITFRRHLLRQEYIPETLGWSQCEKGARKVAENLTRAHQVTSVV